MATTISGKLVSELDTASEQLKRKQAQEPSDGLKILYSEAGPESPIAGIANAAEAIKAYSGDYWGAASIEKFYSAGGLGLTHEDAEGWLNYLERFKPRNFWFKDEGVGVWLYYEDHDHGGCIPYLFWVGGGCNGSPFFRHKVGNGITK